MTLIADGRRSDQGLRRASLPRLAGYRPGFARLARGQRSRRTAEFATGELPKRGRGRSCRSVSSWGCSPQILGCVQDDSGGRSVAQSGARSDETISCREDSGKVALRESAGAEPAFLPPVRRASRNGWNLIPRRHSCPEPRRRRDVWPETEAALSTDCHASGQSQEEPQ